MIDITPALLAMHSAYCSFTNRDLPIGARHLWAWEIFLAKGFKEKDLQLVVSHIKSLIKLKRRRPESFRFHLLVEDTDRFAEDLAEARALNRGSRKDLEKESVLRTTGRGSEVPVTVRTANDVMRGNAEMRKLLELRDAL